MRKVNWGTYRRVKQRVRTLEGQVSALRQLVFQKTGASPETHFLIDYGKALASSPANGVRLVNVSMPAEA